MPHKFNKSKMENGLINDFKVDKHKQNKHIVLKMNSTKMSQVKLPLSPVVVKKGCTLSIKSNDLLRCLKVSSVVREKVIYKSSGEDFISGEYPNLCLVSRQNVSNNRSTAIIARFTREGARVERSSAEIIKHIGQENYDTVYKAICSVKSEELKIRAILALLTADKTENPKTKKTVDAETQTFETSQHNFKKPRTYQRIKPPRFKPYIVHEEEKKIKKVVIDPNTVLLEPKKEPNKTQQDETQIETLPDLREQLFNEDSNSSIGSNFSISSSNIPETVLNSVDKILKFNIEQHTALNTVPLTLLDGTTVMVCAKPMDKFHYTTPDILRNLGTEDRRRLIFQQAIVDWKYCMEVDEDGYLPIHQAVLSNDLDLLGRQCAVLKNKHGTVDVTGGCNATPLQLSIHKDCVEGITLLLRHGADAMRQDDEGRSFFHSAAEVSHRHLQCALEYCKTNARQILMQDDLWDPKFESYPDEKLSKFLLDTICVMVDSAGYTPLMLASKQGNVESTKLLADASPATINWQMPNSGNSALFLAVGAAYMEVSNSSNHSKVPENFMKTIEILVEHGADPSLDNHSNTNVNMLLAEFNIVDLSVLIANKLTINTMITNFSMINDGTQFARNNINGLMLFKNSDGKVNITEINPKKQDPILPSTSQDKESSTKPKKPRTNTNRMVEIIQDDINKVADKAGVPKYVKILPKPTMKFYTHEVKSGKLFKRKMDELDAVVKKVKRTPAILKRNMAKEPDVDGKKVKKTRAKRNSAKRGKKNNMEENSKNSTSITGREIVTVVTTSAANEIKLDNKTLIANTKFRTGTLTNVKGMTVLATIHEPTQKSGKLLKILPKANEIKIKTEKNISDDTSGPRKVADSKTPIVIINDMLLASSEGNVSKT